MSLIKILLFIPFYATVIFGQYPNIRVSSTASTNPEEVTIAINPANPNILAAGANITYFYSSTNGGLNWSQKNMTSNLGVWGDPCVMFDRYGNLYYAHLSNPIQGYWIDRIVIQKSTDYGVTWNNGAGIGYNYPKEQDKEWLAVDMSSPLYRDNVYVAWTEFDNYGSSNSLDSSRILFSRSTDLGDIWSVPVRVSDKGGNCVDEDLTVEGAVPTIGLNGEVYVSWSGPLGIMFDKSTDGGVTFGTDIFVSDQPGGWDFAIPGINRCNGLPITVCDTSYSPFRGNIYINWSDQRNGTSNTDIFLKKSTDGGNSWGQLIKVNNDDTQRHQFFNWMAVDQTTGIIYILFYDRRNTSGSATDVYIAKSTDGGETFENFKISATSFTPSQNIFFGDYANIAAHNRKIYPIWMRMDNSNLSVWTSVIFDSSSIVPVELTSFSAKSEGNNISLNWTTSSELNNYGFEIERANISNTNQTGFIWKNIGFVKGNGTSNIIRDYKFTDYNLLNGYYLYRLKQIDFSGNSNYSKTVEVDIMNPASYLLEQNYPNPFNPTTTISFQIPSEEFVTVKVYDVLGKEIKTILNEIKKAGVYEIPFNGSELSSGLYVYRITAGNFISEKKMILLR
ncbi:MAG: T9SS type A sorting domain-containing protein [Ignavibacteria bacterium]|nr:T9SS type A sorting domain-containing protein [Ignavibacteria bacterium]